MAGPEPAQRTFDRQKPYEAVLHCRPMMSDIFDLNGLFISHEHLSQLPGILRLGQANWTLNSDRIFGSKS